VATQATLSPVGDLYLNGLPFAVASGINISRGGVSISYLDSGAGYKAVPIFALETTTLVLVLRKQPRWNCY
jgi:hypothetical protein